MKYEFKGTPAPWFSSYDDNGFYYVDANTAPSPYIMATGSESEEDKYNAHIVAASPDLLQACIEALSDLSNGYENAKAKISSDIPEPKSINQLRTAIHKALNIK